MANCSINRCNLILPPILIKRHTSFIYINILLSVVLPLYRNVIISDTKLKMEKKLFIINMSRKSKSKKGINTFLFHPSNYLIFFCSQLSLDSFFFFFPRFSMFHLLRNGKNTMKNSISEESSVVRSKVKLTTNMCMHSKLPLSHDLTSDLWR